MEKIVDRNIDLGEFIPQPDDDVIVCRCEEVTKGEIRRAVHDGMPLSAHWHGTVPGPHLWKAGAGDCRPGAGRSAQ